MLSGNVQALAEQAAWQFAKEHSIDLVAICPTSCFGPVISQRADATSVKRIKVCAVLHDKFGHNRPLASSICQIMLASLGMAGSSVLF